MVYSPGQLAIAESAINSAVLQVAGVGIQAFRVQDVEALYATINAANHARVAAMQANMVAQQIGATPCIAACLPGSNGGATAACVPGNMGTNSDGSPNTQGCPGTMGLMFSMMASGEGEFNGMGLGLGKVDYGMILQPLFSFMVAGLAVPMQVLDQKPAAIHYNPSIEQQILADILIINASMYDYYNPEESSDASNPTVFIPSAIDGPSGNGASVNQFLDVMNETQAAFSLGRDIIMENGQTSSSKGNEQGVSHMYLQPITPTDDEFMNEGGLAKYIARGGYFIQARYATGQAAVMGGSRGFFNEILSSDQNKVPFVPTWPTGYCTCTPTTPAGYTTFPGITTPVVTQWQQSRGDGSGFSVYISTANSAVGAGNDGGDGYMIEIDARSEPWYQSFLNDLIGWIKDFENVICSLMPQANAAVQIASAPMCVDKNNKPCTQGTTAKCLNANNQPCMQGTVGCTCLPPSAGCTCTSADLGQTVALVGAEVAMKAICGDIAQVNKPAGPVSCPPGFAVDPFQNVCVPSVAAVPVAPTGMTITTLLLIAGGVGLAYFAFKG